MDSFEINKIIAAILITVLIIFGINKFTDFLFFVEKPTKSAYKVAMVETDVSETTTENEESSNVDIKSFLALGNVEHGKSVFKKCSACHTINKGGSNKIGPALWDVIGKQAGSVAEYKYSKSLLSHGKIWSFSEINGFLIKPSKWIRGTKMAFAGLKDEKDRASVILYLNLQSENPIPIP